MWVDTEDTRDSAPGDGPEPDAGQKAIGSDKPSGGPDSGTDKGGGKQDRSSDTERRIKQLEEELKAVRESERYWADVAKRAMSGREGERGDNPEEPPDDETDEPVDRFLDELSSQGIKALRKRGLLTADEVKQIVREMVEAERSKIMADAEIARKYPELTDEKSKLFSATREIYKEMVERDPSLKNSPVLLEMAARLAKAELGVEENSRRAPGVSAAAAFDRGSPNRSPGSDEGRLSQRQREIIEKFNRAGYRLNEEAYRKRASEGVNLSSGAFYRRGSVEWEG